MWHQIWNSKSRWPHHPQKWTFLNQIVCLLPLMLRWYKSQLLKNQVIMMIWVTVKSAVDANSKDRHAEVEEQT